MIKHSTFIFLITFFLGSAYADDLDVFIEYHSTGCVLLNLSKLGLTLEDELPKNTASRIQRECQQTFNNAVLYTKQHDLNEKVDKTNKQGRHFNFAKDNFFTGCTIIESKKHNHSASAMKNKNSREFKQIYEECLIAMRKGIMAMKGIQPQFD